jgi:hypothetical protein
MDWFVETKYNWLLVWNMNFIFPDIGNVIIPTDELIFFRGVGQPPTRDGFAEVRGKIYWNGVVLLGTSGVLLLETHIISGKI